MAGPDGGDGRDAEADADPDLVDELLDGKHRALARAITKIENRSPGYRGLVSSLHAHTGGADVIGITGSPGAGKSTLVDKLAKAYRDAGLTVGVIAVDPSSPYSGGAVLGDRIRMASNVGDMDVFFRSMSARGQLGGLSTATSDAVKALDAFGKDKIIVETVGAGQNEVDVVRTADTVTVLVQPGSGDDVQMLKAGILEIGDVFVVNKADMDGTPRTVAELEEMIHLRDNPGARLDSGHHGSDAFGGDEALDDGDGNEDGASDETETWHPVVVETVATTGDGVDELVETLDSHAAFLDRTGARAELERTRYAEEIRQLLRSDANALVEEELRRRGGAEAFAERVADRETDPYAVAEDVLRPIRDCVEARRDDA
ncbi:methylmalonyl Co-A mutase-associated GTPase MeaB [Halopelagius longus]|uniref:LAO/AO transport system kinase n=1 Tax=Halopelagius longus TaxID=1236180 RepID=A0A1H1D2X2_9EURY|nr:methylmalonyl Co-A mutase-associated GTPase MeaB [Halopelagius longus]RDI71143.1 methylmalonyl Co-A mutase-associated GTPase MeaB [Halopelagius longus]SDQ70823.1 LAO/AO transport system kinase [Halopelagius longus]